jgi:histidyl-tRNA synthetase
MALSTQPYKGARDFYPEDQRLQNYIISTWSRVLESFGYENYNAPMLESLELYKAKSGEEIVSEQTYTFIDRGGREVVIRPEMTPSVSRMVAARRQELAYPVRWYSIPNLWRYERPQRGRLREHWQLNVDLFGVEGLEGEHEMILIVDAILKTFGAKPSMYQININSRSLMDSIMRDYLGLDETQSYTLAKLIDRMHKMPRAEFVADADAMLTPTQKGNGTSEKLLEILEVKKLSDLPEAVGQTSAAQELTSLFDLLDESGISNAVFDISIMRGFDYYTGIVFEVADTDAENNRSMMGGGRYNGLVGLFGVKPVPTIGFGWGDVTMVNFLQSHDLVPKLPSETEVYAILIGDVYQPAQKLLANLRAEGLTIAVDASKRKPAAKLKNALKKNIRYALFIGEDEIKEGRFNLKDLSSETEQTLSPERIISAVLDERSS